MCGQVMLYSNRKQVFVGETEISLTLKEYQLLEYFIMNQNQVLTKEMIMENIWGIDSEFIDSNTISVMISRLKNQRFACILFSIPCLRNRRNLAPSCST